MGYSNQDTGGCRRHANQKQIPGAVCSFCLRERLSRLSTEADSYPAVSISHRRNGSFDVAAPLGFVLHQGSTNGSFNGDGDTSAGLKKSKSVAWAPRSMRNGIGSRKSNGGAVDKDEKKQGGLWKKLIHSSSGRKKEEGVLMHSMTSVNQRSQDTNSFRIF